MALLQDFNSIKVRLEPKTRSAKNVVETFQFHKGTIRTCPGSVRKSVEPKFQFHKGTIRTGSMVLINTNTGISIP